MTELSLSPSADVLRAAATTPRSFNYRLGRFFLRNYGRCSVLILVLGVINCFWRLSSTAVSSFDEARYGVSASEMLHAHAALVATYGGRPEYWNLKPPLGYWMQELAYLVFGPTVFAMRLPAALCALGVFALTMRTCRRWYGRRAALLAGLIMVTCFAFVGSHGARSGDLDAALTLILLLAVIQIPRLVESGPTKLLWAAMFGLGFLLKSFAILPFAGMTGVYLLWSGDWRRTRWRDWLPAMGLLCAVILGWVLARAWVDGSLYFVETMVRGDLFERATRVLDEEATRPAAYLGVLLDRFAPWPLFILAAALLGRKGRLVPQSGRQRLVLLWALIPLLAFSLVRTQHHWYLDPSYPAWAMLAAAATLSLMASAAQRGRLLIAGLLILGLLFCETRVLLRIAVTDRRPTDQAFLMSLRDHTLVPANQVIQTTCYLSNAERFILQVVDGYHVVEPDQLAMAAASTRVEPHVLMLRRRQLLPASLGGYPASQVIAVNANYVLVKDPAPTPLGPCRPGAMFGSLAERGPRQP